MGIFSTIKNAIWSSDKDTAQDRDAQDTNKAAPAAPATPAAPAAPAAPEPISEDAMKARIAAMPGANALNWQTSIVDLMKLVGVDPSYNNRKELAGELGMEGYEGTAEQNIALHHAVINMLAAEGGAMPAMLKD